MASTSKLSFRSRNLDANRGMRVYFADELPDISECAPVARGVNAMPTGMEKEEEMETHLQDAIHAQQASTSGISDNHVIPTPKVLYIDDARYDQVYPVQPPCKAQLMKVQAWLSMEREEPEYDMDTEDEDYLRDKPHISSRDLEKIMQQLEEQSSESAICQPATARKVLMPHFDDAVIDDVYDYWLAKRKEAATKKILGFGGLIPRIRTECRKENEKLNPYVAFRRRAEKMQTRKNRKNDEDSYEKVLRLGHDLRRAVHLFEMVKRREKSKLAMLDLDSEILETRAQLGDYGSVVYNQILAKLQPEDQSDLLQQSSRVKPLAAAAAAASATAADPALQPLRGEENGVKRKKMRKRVSGLGIGSAPFDRDLPNKAWLKKNAEVWNQSPTAFISGMLNYSPAVEQVDESVAAANSANADGRYAFKRRRGCYYRAAAPLRDKNCGLPSLDSLPPERRFYFVSQPSTSRAEASQPQQKQQQAAADDDESAAAAPAAPNRPASWLLRRRTGRGGRVIFDKFPRPALRAADSAPPHSNRYVAGRTKYTVSDPFELDCVAMDSEETSQWEARPRYVVESEEEDNSFAPPVSSRYLHSAGYRPLWSREDEEADEMVEVDWLATARTPSPAPPPPPRPPAETNQRPPVDDPMGSSPPLEHEDSTSMPTTPLPHTKNDDDDVRPANGTTAAAVGSRVVQQQQQAEEEDEDEEMEEEAREEEHEDEMDEDDGGVISSSDSPIEDSPTSSSEQDHTENHHAHLLPLGVPEGAVHHHLHLASGNASVLSPPDSTAPSPRVSNGSSNGGGGVLSSGSLASHPLAASDASPAPHSNGHNGHAGSGNGLASGYEAARRDTTASLPQPLASDADAWRARAKLVTMAEAVASRLTRVKDPDASSRESGCSPADKSLPSPDGVDDGVVVQLVEPWREPSNSPSESNSSADWTPPASTRTSGDVDARLSAYATLSSEEESGARTGDHPSLPAKPTRKSNGGSSVLQRSYALAAAATTPSPVV